jgi:hypothetical protein
MAGPVMLPQVVQQRHHQPLECFDVFAHSAFLASGGQRRRVSNGAETGIKEDRNRKGASHTDVDPPRSYWPAISLFSPREDSQQQIATHKPANPSRAHERMMPVVFQPRALSPEGRTPVLRNSMTLLMVL